ncbi:MAG: hypothetical protein J6X94_01070 [Lachnospiraceae bacterium]|nr:hypothetical protein [Lachnospiraceae bacterium]
MSDKTESAVQTENSEQTEKTVKTHYDMKMEKRKAAQKREKREQAIWKCAGIVILIAIIAFIASFPIRKYMAMNETVCTIGGRAIGRVEFDYNYNLVKNSYINNYSSVLSYYGMDVNEIENQMYDDTLTFRQYFEKGAVERIKQTIALNAEMANEGYTKDITELYEEYAQTMRDGAKEAGMSLGAYYKQSLGDYASERRIEKFVKESLLVAEFSDYKQNGFEPTDEEIDARYTEDADDYDVFDYKMVRIDAELPDAPTELADEGAAVAEDGSYTPSEAEVAAAMEEARKLADEAETTIMTDGEVHEAERGSVVNYQIRNWILDPSRKEGDTTIVESETTNSYYVAGFVSRYKDENPTLSLRIISTKEDNGAQILSEFAQAGSSEEAFIALYDQYSQDQTTEGGLYEGITGGALPGDLGVWANDSARVAGDVTSYFDETATITYVAYYVGAGKPSWYYTIKNILMSEGMDNYLAGITEPLTVEDPKGNLEYISVEEAHQLLQQMEELYTPADE